MKQKLKETTETITKRGVIGADINRNKSGAMPDTTTNQLANNNGTDLLNGNTTSSLINNNNPEPSSSSILTSGEAFLEQIPSTTDAVAVLNGAAVEGTIVHDTQPQHLSWDSPPAAAAAPSPPRMRTSTMKSGARNPLLARDLAGLSPVKGTNRCTLLERDKSAKRKSNLNRSPHEESTEKRE